MSKELRTLKEIRNRCPDCGSKKLRNNKTLKVCDGLTYRYYRCRWCGSRFRTEDKT